MDVTATMQMVRDCEERCPELDACINASLWCDGTSHCPSGYDEALGRCSIIFKLPPLHLGLAALATLSIISVLCIVTCRICRRQRKYDDGGDIVGVGGSRSISQHRLKSISSETAILDGKEVIC